MQLADLSFVMKMIFNVYIAAMERKWVVETWVLPVVHVVDCALSLRQINWQRYNFVTWRTRGRIVVINVVGKRQRWLWTKQRESPLILLGNTTLIQVLIIENVRKQSFLVITRVTFIMLQWFFIPMLCNPGNCPVCHVTPAWDNLVTVVARTQWLV